MKTQFVYEIDCFGPPIEPGRSQHGFAIKLCSRFARKCAETKTTPEQRDRLFQLASNISKRSGEREIIQFRLHEDSLLLSCINLNIDCCCLGLDHDQQSRLSGKFKALYDYIEYQPHNVDTKNQAYTILSIFLQWASIAKAVTNWDGI